LKFDGSLTINADSITLSAIGDVGTATLDLQSDLVNLFLQEESTYAGVQFLAGQVIISASDVDGQGRAKLAQIRLDATGAESLVGISADAFLLETNRLFIDSEAANNGLIALGNNASAITVANNNAGIALNGNGDAKFYANADNFLRKTSSGIDIRASQFRLLTSGDRSLDLDSSSPKLNLLVNSNEIVKINTASSFTPPTIEEGYFNDAEEGGWGSTSNQSNDIISAYGQPYIIFSNAGGTAGDVNDDSLYDTFDIPMEFGAMSPPEPWLSNPSESVFSRRLLFRWAFDDFPINDLQGSGGEVIKLTIEYKLNEAIEDTYLGSKSTITPTSNSNFMLLNVRFFEEGGATTVLSNFRIESPLVSTTPTDFQPTIRRDVYVTVPFPFTNIEFDLRAPITQTDFSGSPKLEYASFDINYIEIEKSFLRTELNEVGFRSGLPWSFQELSKDGFVVNSPVKFTDQIAGLEANNVPSTERFFEAHINGHTVYIPYRVTI
jgi:hypothetical protein